MSERILCVDDDPHVLDAYRRQLRKSFQIDTAESGAQALEAIAQDGPYAVILSDMQMPGMNGSELLAKAKGVAPDTVRMVLTGHSDQSVAMEAINEGHIFRFLRKPCSGEPLAEALRAGLKQYKLVRAEKELLERTLRGSIKVLTEVLALVNPTAFGRASRIRRLVRQLGAELHVEEMWQVEVAAMLSQIGCVTLPQATVDKIHHGKTLTSDEWAMVRHHPTVGRDLVAHIPRLDAVAEIIAYQEKHFDGGGIPPDTTRGEDIPLGARILKVALDFDTSQLKGFVEAEALVRLQQRSGRYDPHVLKALRSVVCASGNNVIEEVLLKHLTNNMILAQDVRTADGRLLVSKGQEVTTSLRQRLGNFALTTEIPQPLRVIVRSRGAQGSRNAVVESL